jgi:nitrate reductase cytochrome c-type subunit
MRILLLSLLLLISCHKQQTLELDVDKDIIEDSNHHTGLLDSKSCGECHQNIYNEWKGSYHANSSYFKDPIHKAVVDSYQKFKKKKGKPVDYHCASCHTPMANNKDELMKGLVALDRNNKSHLEGVSCRTCHSMTGINYKKNFDRPVYDKNSIVFGTGSSNGQSPHPVKNFTFQDIDQVCLSCHAHKHNGKGTAICLMGGEKGEYKKQKGRGCVSCHMMEVPGEVALNSKRKSYKSHAFYGGHQIDKHKDIVSIRTSTSKNSIRVQIKNLTGHSFPSTQPLRQVAIFVTAKKSGKIVWKNNVSHENRTLLMLALASKNNKFPVPPWMAHKRLFDSRLQAGEVRELEFKDLPQFDDFEVKLKYRLISPEIAKKFGVESRFSAWRNVSFSHH